MSSTHIHTNKPYIDIFQRIFYSKNLGLRFSWNSEITPYFSAFNLVIFLFLLLKIEMVNLQFNIIWSYLSVLLQKVVFPCSICSSILFCSVQEKMSQHIVFESYLLFLDNEHYLPQKRINYFIHMSILLTKII